MRIGDKVPSNNKEIYHLSQLRLQTRILQRDIQQCLLSIEVSFLLLLLYLLLNCFQASWFRIKQWLLHDNCGKLAPQHFHLYSGAQLSQRSRQISETHALL